MIYNSSIGRENVISDSFMNNTVNDNNVLDSLAEAGYVDLRFNTITDEGIKALSPYKVDNAVILAAGASTRFVPLSLERPKGLYEVRGERLVERQIEQLREAGIEDITLVLGYKKEMFFYLREKYGVKFIFNDLYNVKNNIESIYVARNELKNTYICNSDNYFVENPFNKYEFESFYAGMKSSSPTNEMYVKFDDTGKIVSMCKGLSEGYIAFGQSFWKRDFGKRFIEIVDETKDVGVYDNLFWEWLVRDHLADMPPFYFKEYSVNSVYEFDYFDDLRKFDRKYVKDTESKIIANIKSVFSCEDSDIFNFRNISEGMTNTSFIFKYGGEDYIYRHPGDGTSSIISRANEKSSLEIAKKYEFDPTYVFMDVNEGFKISAYINPFREPEYDDFEDTKAVCKVLRRLHSIDARVDYGLSPWEDAEKIEKMLVEKDPECFDGFRELKDKIGRLYKMTEGDGIAKCFCHGDTYKHNWMIKPDGEVILIDWEYSGYSDPGIDVGYYIVDAMYGFDEAKAMIREYLADDFDDKKEFHFLAYSAIIAYYWFVWAMYRESCGASMGESLYNWYRMSEKYADYLLSGGENTDKEIVQ